MSAPRSYKVLGRVQFLQRLSLFLLLLFFKVLKEQFIRRESTLQRGRSGFKQKRDSKRSKGSKAQRTKGQGPGLKGPKGQRAKGLDQGVITRRKSTLQRVGSRPGKRRGSKRPRDCLSFKGHALEKNEYPFHLFSTFLLSTRPHFPKTLLGPV